MESNVWHELVKNEIWIQRDFFSENLLTDILDKMNFSDSLTMQPGPEIREQFKKAKINPTLYCYTVHKTEVRRDLNLVDFVFGKFSQITGTKPSCEKFYNPLQIFTKSFTLDSFYDLHVEPAAMYGEYAYVIFLEDVATGGELVFPDQDAAKDFIDHHPDQSEGWNGNLEMMAYHGEHLRWAGPLTIRPEKNLAVLFRVGTPHYVNKVGKNELGVSRRSLTGWPYCSTELIQNLNENCGLQDKFVAQKCSQ